MASKDAKCHELTEAEKHELTAKVFPSLKAKRGKNPIMRLLKLSHGIMIILLTVSCAVEPIAVKQNLPNPSENALIIKNGMTKADDPKEFEMSMPETEIGLGLVYKYSKEPTVIKISDNVIDFDFDNGVLAILKEDRLETNAAVCPTIGLNHKFTSAALRGGLVLLNSAEKAQLADISKCGIVGETSTKGRGVALSESGFLEFTKTAYSVYDRYRTAETAKGSFQGGVIFGQMIKDKLLFATENGKIALVDAKTGKFLAINEGVTDFSDISAAEDGFYVLTKSNTLVRLIPDLKNGILAKSGEAKGKDGCFLLKKSGFMSCDGYITGVDRAFKSPFDADSGLFTQGLLFLKKGDLLYFADSEVVYKKSVVFGRSGKVEICLSDGKSYFNDLDGSVKYFTADGTESRSDKMPETCGHRFELKGGMIKSSDGRMIYKFADEVAKSDKAVMLKRIIGHEIYYYFEPR